MIVDTDVLIWDLRGSEAARTTLAQAAPFSLSVVTYMELLHGLRNKTELQALRRQLRRWGATILQIDENISSRAMLYVEEFFLSHAVTMADALIAATALVHHDAVLTANAKHYRPIPGVQVTEFVA